MTTGKGALLQPRTESHDLTPARSGKGIGPGKVPANLAWGSLAAMVLLLMGPSLFRSGFLFERDASFFTSVRADVHWSVGTFSFLGGSSTIGVQGLFYAPYGVVDAALGALGLSASDISKLVPLGIAVLAVTGCFRLLQELGATTVGAVLGSALFLLNPWSLDQFGFFFLWTGYCLLPLVIRGARKVLLGGRTPYWYPLVLAFLGGVISWVIAFLAITAVVVTIRHSESGYRRHIGRAYIWYLAAGLYWIPAYSVWALRGDTSGLGYSSAGGVLESRRPLTDLFELRDFWWPHLLPAESVGRTVAGIGTVAALCIVVLGIWASVTGLSRDRIDLDARLRPLPGGFLVSLLFIGLILGEGTSGALGGLYSWAHGHSPIAGSFIASLMRSPADLAAPFVLAICLALGRRHLSYPGYPVALASRILKRQLPPWILVGPLAILIALGVVPSLAAFWSTYEPVRVPSSYSRLAAAVPAGTALELGDWELNAIDPGSGVWHFTWSDRIAADPTVLTASLGGPVLGATSPGLVDLGVRLLGEPDPAGAARQTVTLAHDLGVNTLVIEDDLATPPSDQQQVVSFVDALRNTGIRSRVVGQEIIFYLPDAARPPIWSPTCRIATGWEWLGAISVHCRASGPPPVLLSAFPVPTRTIEVGVTLGPAHHISEGLGTAVTLTRGRSGWIVDPVQTIASLGGIATCLAIGGFLAGAAARRLKARYARREES